MSPRREFLAVTVTALSSARVVGANNRIRIATIGTGGRGAFHTRYLAGHPEVDVVALCDVYRTRAEKLRGEAQLRAEVVQDHRRVLDRKDVDAVVIATCDHWHAPILLDALSAGKDVFVEKPMSFRVEEGLEIVEAVRRTQRIVQTGTQQKSGPHFLEAKERFVDSGRIGRVSLVRTWWMANGGYFQQPPAGFVYNPSELDWDRFLGRAAKRSFDAQRYFGWFSYRDYSAGQPGGLFVHLADVVYLFLGLRAPELVVACGGIYQPSAERDIPDTISILAEYGGKLTLTFDATLYRPEVADIEFHGSGGVLRIFRYGYAFRPTERGAPTIEAKGQPCDPPHMDNFLDAVRRRKQPNADVVYSHYLTAVCHMANLALERKAPVRWNPAWDVRELG